MKTISNLNNYKSILLTNLEIPKFCDNLWNFFKTLDNSLIYLQICLYDADIEEFSEIINFGEAQHFQNSKQINELLNQFENQEMCLLNDQSYWITLKRNEIILATLILNKLNNITLNQLKDIILEYPLTNAFTNVIEFNELKQDTIRYRTRYEDLENQNLQQIEDTRNLITQLELDERLKIERAHHDKIIYSISSKVANYEEINDVALAIVNLIGTEYGLDTCILILNNENDHNQNSLYEYKALSKNSLINHLNLPEGKSLINIFLNLKSPQEFYNINGLQNFENVFLNNLDLIGSLVIPIISGDATQGVLIFKFKNPLHNWTIEQMTRLTTLSGILGVTLTNAYLRNVIKQQAITDGLTGIYNRRSFNESLAKEFERAKRYQETLTLIIIDLDFLKKINDTYGHKVGDAAIKGIGTVLKTNSRTNDFCARYGGEEFCVLLPNTDTEMAAQIAQRIRILINEIQIEGPGVISASLGVASYPIHASDSDSLFNKADEALYEAKKTGRNKVIIANNNQITKSE